MKKYVVKLTAEERIELERLIRKGKAAAWKVQRAWALLKCDQGKGGPGWSDEKIAEAFGCTTRSLESWRKQAVENGPTSLLERKPRDKPANMPKLDGENMARLTKLACSQAPKGHSRWTLRLLAEKLVELEIVDDISHETVRRALKKRSKAVA
jgi:transposase